MTKKKDNARTPTSAAWEALRKAHRDKSHYTFTPEHSANLSKAQKGRTCTPETRAKMSAAKKGRKCTPLHRANMSAGQLARTDQDTRTRVCAKARDAYHAKLKDPYYRYEKRQRTLARRKKKQSPTPLSPPTNRKG